MISYISILLGLLLVVMFPHNTLAADSAGSEESGENWVVDINVSSEDSEVIYTENAWRIENLAPGDEFHTQINIVNDSEFPLQIISITSSGTEDNITPEEKEFAHQFVFTLSKDGETVLTGRLDASLYVPQAVQIPPHSTVTYDLTITFLESAGNEYQDRSYSDSSFNLIFSVTDYTDDVEEILEIIIKIIIIIISEIKEWLGDLAESISEIIGAIIEKIESIIDAIIEKIKDLLGREDGTDSSGGGSTDGSGSGDGSSDGSSSGDGSSDGSGSGDGSSSGTGSGDGSSDGSSSGDGSSDGSGSGDGSSDGSGSGDGSDTTGVLAGSGLIIIEFVGLVHSAATASAIWTRFTQDANSIRYEYFKLLFRRKKYHPDDTEDIKGLEDIENIEKEIDPFEDDGFTKY